jgi:GNAT superfamily N-acetyltransferase
VKAAPLMGEFRVVTAAEVEPSRLDEFLCGAYGPTKGEFLRRYGAWWHRGDENRLAVVRGNEIAAYCAVIPTRCRIDGETHPAVWWVDLIVLPEFRGQGLQHLLDERLRAWGDLKLGFPNPLAALLHLRHGWGVREDFRTLMLPLEPRRTRIVRSARGTQGALLRLGAVALSPAAWLLRRRFSRYQPSTARAVENPDPHALAAIFERHGPRGVATTCRDGAFIQWRYLDAPYRAELKFYVAGPADDPTLALISRSMASPSGTIVRFLDLFGDLEDAARLRDIVLLALGDAARDGALQVTVLAALPRLRSFFRSLGFLFGSKARFCWHSHSPDLLQLLERKDCHFSFADSDSDAPD